MIQKNKFNLILILFGTIFVGLGIYFMITELFQNYIGILFGIGGAMCGVGFANIFSDIISSKNPKLAEAKNIALNDERNKFLAYKTKATIYDINIYILTALALVTTVIKVPFWILMSLLAILIIDMILYVLIFYKNNKKN